MIVVCTCGQKSRVKQIEHSHKIRCGNCKQSLVDVTRRQAARNANIVLDVAAILANKLDTGRITPEEELIAQIFAKHERDTK